MNMYKQIQLEIESLKNNPDLIIELKNIQYDLKIKNYIIADAVLNYSCKILIKKLNFK